MSDRLSDYLKQDRQWKRYQRIGHAKYMLSVSTQPLEIKFWHSVLEANDASA